MLADFTREELLILRDIIRRVRRLPYGSPSIPDPQIFPSRSQDVGVVSIPNFIPPYDGNFLGKAECENYVVTKQQPTQPNSDTKIDPVEMPGPVVKKTWIHNPYRWPAFGITANDKQYMKVYKDKKGQWLCEKPQQLLKCKAAETIQPGQFGLVDIWIADNPTQFQVVAYLNWAHGNSSVDTGEEAFIFFFPDEGNNGRWVIIPKGKENKNVRWVNRSGFTVPPGGVMSVTGEEIINQKVYATCHRPGGEFKRFWLINNSQYSVPNGAARIDGSWGLDPGSPTLAAVDVTVPITPGQSRGPKPGSFLLFADRPGFTMLGGSEVVDQFTVAGVVQHQVNHLIGVLSDDLNKGATAHMSILFKGADEEDSGFNDIVVEEMFLNEQEFIRKYTMVSVIWYSNRWIVVNAHCEQDDDRLLL